MPRRLALRTANENWQRVILEIDKADLYYCNLNTTSAPLLWYRGMANFSLGRIRKALRDFQKAYVHNNCYIHVINNLGACCAILQDFKKAVDYFQKALAVSLRFEKAIINLRVVYYQMRKYYKQPVKSFCVTLTITPRLRQQHTLKRLKMS